MNLQSPESQLSPFHAGEQAVQQQLGVRDIEQWARKVVRDHLPDQHRQFFKELPFLVVSGRDVAQRPWVTLLSGPAGFVTSADARHLHLAARPGSGDALADAFSAEADMGILGIEMATRRRNRVNGRVTARSDSAIEFAVEQSFGNCPQYIREREWYRAAVDGPAEVRRSGELSASQMDWIGAADTFFIASGYRGEGDSATFGMDASHRGGEAGFVRVLDGQRLQFPDYAGNNHFNTIGNFALDPRAGYLFVDFATGSLLQLTGSVEIDWDSAALHSYPGAHRLITLTVEEVVEQREAIGLRWREPQAAQPLRVITKTTESADVTSFLLAAEHSALAPFTPGQHLPVELHMSRGNIIRRSYSLSGDAAQPFYRISVKREAAGLASQYLHDEVGTGAIIYGRPPAGTFVLPEDNRPLVLLSAGVGVTPMASMLHAVVQQNRAPGSDTRQVWFVHGARDGAHHALAGEIRALAADDANISLQTVYSRPQAEDRQGVHYDLRGRIDMSVLRSVIGQIGPTDAHYFMCGPATFLADMQLHLQQLGVTDEQIHFETFG